MMDNNNHFEIKFSNISLRSATESADLTSGRKSELRTVDILALPTKNYHNKGMDSFFSGARDFYMYCKANAPDYAFDFCIEKTKYLEIDLNSIELFLGTFLISSVIIPIFVNLLSNYLSSKLIHNDDKITINIIINNVSNNNSAEISFRGTRIEFDNKVLKPLSSYNKYGRKELTKELGGIVNVLS
jgi:hypothetical protein